MKSKIYLRIDGIKEVNFYEHFLPVAKLELALLIYYH
jgi:hypothetical protein